MVALARAELTLFGRNKGPLIATLFVPLVLPFSVKSAAKEMDLAGAGLTTGTLMLPAAVGFSLLFAVYSALVGVFVVRREELVLKRLRTGELRDVEILAGSATPALRSGLVRWRSPRCEPASAPRHVVSLPRSRGVCGASTTVRRHIRPSSAALTRFRVMRIRQGNSRSSTVTSRGSRAARC